MTIPNAKTVATSDTQQIAPKPLSSTHDCQKTCIPDMASSRRRFMQMALGATLAGSVTAAGVELVAPRPVRAQSKLTPDAALQELMDGNRRFTSGRLTAFDQDLAILKRNTVEKQEPFAA